MGSTISKKEEKQQQDSDQQKQQVCQKSKRESEIPKIRMEENEAPAMDVAALKQLYAARIAHWSHPDAPQGNNWLDLTFAEQVAMLRQWEQYDSVPWEESMIKRMAKIFPEPRMIIANRPENREQDDHQWGPPGPNGIMELLI